MPAETPNAASCTARTSTPIADAAISLSRIAMKARPERDLRRLTEKMLDRERDRQREVVRATCPATRQSERRVRLGDDEACTPPVQCSKYPSLRSCGIAVAKAKVCERQIDTVRPAPAARTEIRRQSR